jgi:hypothetical protein
MNGSQSKIGEGEGREREREKGAEKWIETEAGRSLERGVGGTDGRICFGGREERTGEGVGEGK